MKQMRNILVPTDFSANARVCFDKGVEIAREQAATLHLLHVVDVSLFGPPYIPQNGFVLPMEQEEVFTRLEQLRRDLPDLHVVIHACVGQPATEIVNYAKDNEVDLICISTHGRRGLKRHLLGSTTEAVVRLAPCLVLSMHADTSNTLASSAPPADAAEH